METLIRRQDRVQADVRCLMCGRLIGQLFGFIWRDMSGRRAARSLTNLTTFRPAQAGATPVALGGGARFRCIACGGFGIIEEVSTDVVSEQAPGDWLCPVHGERLQVLGRGRPPKECRCKGRSAAA